MSQALKIADAYDMMIMDGAPHATLATVEIGKRAHLVILPTGLSLDDLEPTVLLANALTNEHGVPLKRIAMS